jgi:hypothetical protein
MNDTETIIKNYYLKMNNKASKEIIDNKIKKIFNNCKINNTFSQFIKLLIKFDINIFEKSHLPDIVIIKKHEKLLSICKKHKNNLLLCHGIKVLKYSDKDNPIELIASSFDKLKKDIDDIDIVIYILENIYTDDKILNEMCNLSSKKYIEEYKN